jgi:hypothetical protein
VRKKILLLFPYRFTEFTYYKFEISKLEKKYNLKVIIHDLSNIVTSKKLNSAWKTKLEKKTLKFSSLISWFFYFNKIRKEKIIIFNHIKTSNLNSFIINSLIKLSKLPVMLYEEADPFPIFKKNIHFFFSRIKWHGFNYKIYLFYLKLYFFKLLDSLIKYERIYLLSNIFYKKNYGSLHGSKKKKFIKIDFNSWDYSNALSIKQNKKKKFIKKYIIYIDCPAPYFSGDAYLTGGRIAEGDIKKCYHDLNLFFDKIEKYFNAKVIVIPHPKYKSSNPKKIKSLNPYFNNRIVNNDYDSLAKLSPNCLFFINSVSTALSYAIFHHKPIIHIFSSQQLYQTGLLECIFSQSKNTGKSPIDICKINKKKIMKNLTINKSKYKYYKYQYLTPKNKTVEKIPNYKIIGDFIEKHF